MKLSFILTGLCSVVVVALWAAPPTGQAATKEITIKGTFVWSNMPEKTHDLQAKLTPTGPNEWKAVWNFEWKNKPMTYIGAVKGDLRNGKVAGTGNTTEGKERSFTFEGTAKDGVIKMKHSEVTKDNKPTGHGELRVVN